MAEAKASLVAENQIIEEEDYSLIVVRVGITQEDSEKALRSIWKSFAEHMPDGSRRYVKADAGRNHLYRAIVHVSGDILFSGEVKVGGRELVKGTQEMEEVIAFRRQQVSEIKKALDALPRSTIYPEPTDIRVSTSDGKTLNIRGATLVTPAPRN